jgi:hypothetical protein
MTFLKDAMSLLLRGDKMTSYGCLPSSFKKLHDKRGMQGTWHPST